MTIKSVIKNLGELLRIKSIDKALLHTHNIDFAFCFFFLLEEVRILLNELNLYSPQKIDDYLVHLRNTAISQGIYHNKVVDYSFSFFYVLDEFTEFLAI